MWLTLLAACLSDDDVAVEMERALLAANEATIHAALASELFRWTDAPPTTARHGEICGCPCRTRVDRGEGDFELSLDYVEAGCLPDSRLVGLPVSGHAVLEVRDGVVSVSTDGLAVSGSQVTTPGLSGSVAEGTQQIEGRISIGTHPTDLALDVRFEGEAVRLTGSAVTDSGRVTLDDVGLRLDDVGIDCPRPTSGRFEVAAEKEPVTIDPGHTDTTALASWRGRSSTPVAFCDYAPAWY